jgi:hypothetical protein
MRPEIGSRYRLTDHAGHDYGEIQVAEIRPAWVIGKLAHGRDFPLVQNAFAQLEEVANEQMLSFIDEVTNALDKVGFRVCSIPEEDCQDVFDVQVMNGNDISFKLRDSSS